MLRIPSSKKRKTNQSNLKLIPFADSLLVFIFFILMSATFYHIHDSGNNVAMATVEHASALTLKMSLNEMTLLAGHSGAVLHKFHRQARTGRFNYEEIHSVLGDLKKNKTEIVLEPENELTYEEITKILDVVRSQFNKILFGNLAS